MISQEKSINQLFEQLTPEQRAQIEKRDSK
jgi:Spy/CpxP family protein refolding chaperone